MIAGELGCENKIYLFELFICKVLFRRNLSELNIWNIYSFIMRIIFEIAYNFLLCYLQCFFITMVSTRYFIQYVNAYEYSFGLNSNLPLYFGYREHKKQCYQ